MEIVKKIHQCKQKKIVQTLSNKLIIDNNNNTNKVNEEEKNQLNIKDISENVYDECIDIFKKLIDIIYILILNYQKK